MVDKTPNRPYTKILRDSRDVSRAVSGASNHMSTSVRRFLGLAVAGVAVITLSVCGGGDSGSSGGPTAPAPPVTPAPTPEPLPTPAPLLSASCRALPLGDARAGCNKEQATFQQQMDDAIRTLQAEQPGLFDNNLVVQATGAYYLGLIEILDREGLCAFYDGEELGVTNTAEYNDQYDVLTAKNRMRIGETTYRSTCYPSAVPLDLGVPPPSGGNCSLPGSREIACSKQESGLFFGPVESAVNQVMEERPDLFDFDDFATGNGPRVLDLAAYTQAVIDLLEPQGYCAKDDRGEELAIKNENGFSEQYDIQFADKYVRTGQGIYRSTCYPAAF